MDIIKKQNGQQLTINLVGRLDTTTAPDLENTLKESINGINELIFDFEKLEYISSAGLRVLLEAQKIMNNQGTLKVINVIPEVNEVFEITGFSSILTIEQ